MRSSSSRLGPFLLVFFGFECLALERPAFASSQERKIAITIDDLPATATNADSCSEAELLELNRAILGALESAEVQAAGLVTGSRICDAIRETALPKILDLWLAAGHDLGNHTFSHRDLNSMPVEEYQKDIVRNENLLTPVLRRHQRELRYFRHPFLHSGVTESSKEAIDSFLSNRGYQIAPVTIDNQEWVFSAAYAFAVRDGNRELADKIGDAYLEFMSGVTEFFEQWSVDVLGREPAQILLIHANDLNADRLDDLLEMLSSRGYRFVSLDQALTDPAYQLGNPYIGRRGLSWIHRWALAKGMTLREEPREPAWIAELFERSRSSSSPTNDSTESGR